MKIWVFSQVSRFSLEPPILIFESPIQSGGSFSLILESSPSGVISPVPQNPQSTSSIFSYFRSRVYTYFHSRRISPPNLRRFLHYMVIRARVGVSPRFVSDLCFSFRSASLRFPFEAICGVSRLMFVVLCLVSPCTQFWMRHQDSRVFSSSNQYLLCWRLCVYLPQSIFLGELRCQPLKFVVQLNVLCSSQFINLKHF